MFEFQIDLNLKYANLFIILYGDNYFILHTIYIKLAFI